mgnify:CR=1 FL=1
MVNRRQFLAGLGSGITGVALGVGGTRTYDALTDFTPPEVEAQFTDVGGDIDDWALTGEIRVHAGDEDAEVTGYVDDRVPVKQETVEAGEEKVYDNLSVSGSNISSHTIDAIVRTNRGKYTDSAEFEVGLDDFNDEETGKDGNNDAVDEGKDFGLFSEDDYLEQSSRSRNRFETRLDEEFGEFLDEMRVFESSDEFYLDRKSGDTEYGALRLDGNYDDARNVVGFDTSFAEDLHRSSGNDVGGFVDFLEYAENRS